MRETVYRVLALLCGVVAGVPVGTNPGLVCVLWLLVSGRLLGRAEFPTDFPLPVRIRAKASVTDHLPKGSWGQRRRRNAGPARTPSPGQPKAVGKAA